jgi:hypothetical protein
MQEGWWVSETGSGDNIAYLLPQHSMVQPHCLVTTMAELRWLSFFPISFNYVLFDYAWQTKTKIPDETS